jgi:hypothetical protein
MINLQRTKYYGDMEAATSVVSKWLESKPDNRELQAVAEALTQSVFYVNSLELQAKELQLTAKYLDSDISKLKVELKDIKDSKPTPEELRFMQMTSEDDNDRINSIL